MTSPDLISLPWSLQLLAAILLASGIFALCWSYFQLEAPSLPYPPGPPGKGFLSGNMSDIPTTKSWEIYAEWGKKYGEIVHLRIYSQHMVVLNSFEVAKDLLEKRSSVYSDRPQFSMIKLMNWDFNMGLKPYGDEWRIHRRLLQQSLRPLASLTYRSIQTRKVNDMLYGILTNPEDLSEHYKTFAAATIMSIVYGHDIAPKNDYFVTLSEAAVKRLSEAIFPGARAVNALPILRYLPACFPGAGFKRYGRETSELTHQMQEVPFDFVHKAMAAGNDSNSMVAKLITNQPDETKQAIKEVAATSYAAGADTTVSALGTFFYAMAMFPDVQQKAQHEIDAITGSDRLVNYDDRESLPYVEALFREVLRWRPVLPLGVAHSTTVEDIYRGHYIPKGATVIANIWAISHDPKKFEKPEAFDPDRYFDDKGNLIAEEIYAFGFGRRVCVGRHLAASTVWLAIAATLSTFSIRKKKDAFGNEIPLDGKYTDRLIR
ncbi:hypothetical protein GALMADRAFT_238276 [Galerina marginata CBS 339.88]|uniref:Cytochrome P450 n=1 Tax=Galerina marginata (strain CBS 339.88) TaxID=685588 RepID=A0A067TK99_GALM3|nr:hypothetical protein GALMADRAFT_238276 [Galerina marginata CBS 339.88]